MSLLPIRGLGRLGPDPHDPRDLHFSAHRLASLAAATSASVDNPIVAPKDQLRTSSCVGQACSQALRLAYLKRGLDCPELSASYLYRLSLNLDGSTDDVGTYLRTGVNASRRMGCATEEAWPFSEERILVQPTFAADHSAFDRNGVRAHYRIAAGDVEGVRRALAGGLPVVGGWEVDEAFVSSDGRGLIDAIRGPIVGGHAMAIVGFDPSGNTILGSWGPFYGDYGRIRVTDAFIAQGTDLWALDVSGGAL